MNKLPLALFSIFLLCMFFSCGGGGSSNGGGKEGELPPVKASINLRLGQLSKTNSPVAVSAALENGESIVIFNQAMGSSQNTSVSYNNSQNETLLADFDISGRPKMAQTKDALLTFNNYTKTGVDITINIGSNQNARSNQKDEPITRTLINQPIDPEALNFLDGDTMIRILLGLEGDTDSGTRALLAAAFSSLKIVGCTSIDVLGQLQAIEDISPGILTNVSSSICGSQLLESVEEILDQTDYEEITVTQLNSPPACDLPFSFDTATQCAVTVGEQNVIAAQNGFVDDFPTATPVSTPETSPEATPSAFPSLISSPSPIASVVPSVTTSPSLIPPSPTPTATPSPTPTPTPSITPTPTPTPPNSLNLGPWVGTAAGSSRNTGCRDFMFDFVVGINGDNTCKPPNPCVLVGVFLDNENFMNFPLIQGTVDDIGHFVFTGKSMGSISNEDLASDGNFNINGTAGSGNFTITFGSCSGTVSLSRPN